MLSQKQKILTLMCQSPNRWFYPYDFMDRELGDLFVGYKAGTRISGLNHDYPNLFSKRVEGKYTQHKINADTVGEWFNTLPKDLRQVVAHQLNYYPYQPVD